MPPESYFSAWLTQLVVKAKEVQDAVDQQHAALVAQPIAALRRLQTGGARGASLLSRPSPP